MQERESHISTDTVSIQLNNIIPSSRALERTAPVIGPEGLGISVAGRRDRGEGGPQLSGKIGLQLQPALI